MSDMSGTGAPSTGESTRNLPRGLVLVLGAAAAVVAVDGMKQMGWLLAPLLLAMMLVIAVTPVQGWLIQRKFPRWAATVVVLLTLYAIIVSLVTVLTISVARLATLLPSYSTQFSDLIEQGTALLAKYGVGTTQITQVFKDLDLGKVASLLSSVLSSLSNVTSMMLLLLSAMFFMGLDAAGLPQRLTTLWQHRPVVAQALTSFARGTRRYLVVSSIFGAVVSILTGIALQILGVPLPWLWAVLSFITNYIPNIGFVIALVPPSLLALLDQGPRTMVLVIVILSVINFGVQSLIQPKIVGDDLGLAVTLTFVATLFWSWVLGPLGALLAIPMTLLVKALLIDVDPDVRWINILLGDGKAPAEKEPVEKAPATAPKDLEEVSPEY